MSCLVDLGNKHVARRQDPLVSCGYALLHAARYAAIMIQAIEIVASQKRLLRRQQNKELHVARLYFVRSSKFRVARGQAITGRIFEGASSGQWSINWQRIASKSVALQTERSRVAPREETQCVWGGHSEEARSNCDSSLSGSSCLVLPSLSMFLRFQP